MPFPVPPRLMPAAAEPPDLLDLLDGASQPRRLVPPDDAAVNTNLQRSSMP